MRSLSGRIKIYGLSKQKLIIVLIVISIIVITGIFIGTLLDNHDNNVNVGNQLIDNVRNIRPDQNSGSIDQLLLEAENKKIKNVVVESNVVIESKNIVPPIKILPNKDVSEDPVSHELEENNKRQARSKYMSYHSKSLMYVNTPGLNNQSSTASLANPNGVIGQFGIANKSLDQINQNLTKTNDRQINNESNSKVDFLKNQAVDSPKYLNEEITDAKSPFELKAGSVIPALMINGLNSDLPGEIIAQVRENIYDSVSRRYLLIPQGARLIGLYDSNIAYGQERILVVWNRLIYPDGSSINLKAMPGTDLEGYAGFYDEVDNKYWQIFGSSFILGVITGALQYSQNNTNANVQSGGIGLTNTNPTVGQTLSGSLGQQLGQTGLTIAQKNLNVAPTLIVKPNYPFNIMLTADMILRPLRVLDNDKNKIQNNQGNT